MPVRTRMQMEGTDQIARRLRALGFEGHEHLREAALAGAEVIRQAIEDRAPRGKGDATYKGKPIGHMADNIVAEVTQERGGRLEIQVGPDKLHFYAMFVEFGHALVRVVNRVRVGGRVRRIKKELGNVPPHPFMRPAYDESEPRAQTVIAAELRRRLRLK